MKARGRREEETNLRVRDAGMSGGTTPENLRSLALQYLRGHKLKSDPPTASDLATLVSELEIHQAELEVQNEELRRIQLELMEVRDRYRNLYEFAPVGYLSLDSHGVIKHANLAATKICGVNRDALIGSRIERFVAREDRDSCYKLLQKALKTEGEEDSSSLELRLGGADGRSLWIGMEVSSMDKASGTGAGYLVVFTEITARKMAEEDLRRSNELLESRVADRTRELQQIVGSLTSEVLQRQNAEKGLKEANRQLMSRAAQLRALAGELTLAEQRERRRLAKVLHDHLQQMLVAGKYRAAILGRAGETVVKEAAREIELLLDQCIATSRSLTAELSPPILQEAGFLKGLEWLARWMEDQHSLRVELTFERNLPSLRDDTNVLLFESVRELLFNAVKHAHARLASVAVRRAENNMLQVTVGDRGSGFEADKIKGAGEPGGGFGLFGIRERLDMFGGRMEIDSSPGNGSWITLTVPLGSAAPAAEPVTAPPDSVRRGKHVQVRRAGHGAPIRLLLADDHVIMRQGLTRLFGEEKDIEIVGEAADGQQAVELADKLHPDVILMDVSMPNLSGIDATRTIHQQHPEIRVIGLSMFEAAEQAQAMHDAGASDYVAKSGPSCELIAAIRNCMSRQPE